MNRILRIWFLISLSAFSVFAQERAANFTFTVSGEVNGPLTFHSARKVSILEALALGNGVTDRAGQYVVVKRKRPSLSDVEELRVSLNDIKRGSVNIYLQDGDEVIVLTGDPPAITEKDKAKAGDLLKMPPWKIPGDFPPPVRLLPDQV
jgi:protein involved in polysaccharide export with SLBB domain